MVDLLVQVARTPHLITFRGMRQADAEKLRSKFVKQLKVLLMQRTNVESSNIKPIGFWDGVLEVEFKSGGVYSYMNVPESLANSFLMSNSKGQFFHQHIKDKFLFVKQDEEKAA